MTSPPQPSQRLRSFQVREEPRTRYGLDDDLFDPAGPLALADAAAARVAAGAINEGRDAARVPEMAVSGGDLLAVSLIQEILRTLIARRRAGDGGDALADAVDRLDLAIPPGEVSDVLLRFTSGYPPTPVYRGTTTADEFVAMGEADDRVASVEELVLLRLANENPAFSRVRELCSDDDLDGTAYSDVIRELEAAFAGDGSDGVGAPSFFDTLRAPFLASPTSLSGQLDFIRSNWGDLLGDRFAPLLQQMLRVLDVIGEEQTTRGGGPGRPSEVLGASDLRRGREEYERFSQDESWMPSLVLMARSTYVWLDQLSKKHQADIHRLDQVPDAELDALADGGFTGLWLIGLWERSRASRRIKHLRGDPEAVASAYALYDYEIAADLGGRESYEDLRDRAWSRGIRLASDMVPNHVGIDGRWVVEHPDWFLSLPYPPYPGYEFGGPDLSEDPRVAIHIEDHYWDGTDAAVVFKRYDRETGDTRFIYHGNDGTSMPWNDTAQLDYLSAEVREGVIQTILHVARMFPIIRFDAAMTLAKQHIQRLWFPPPGHGGAIPSRSEHGITDAEFEALIPEEFWREVVDRVAAEAPDTLLLAEAFWMLEGYFVRTLGMHRVYNSAFMHMTAQEDNAKYRRLIKDVIEFDPEILKRFVNFMNNPDEETAAVQFGTGDKYFGVVTLMVTMPGLPMFGHGQLEGFREKYGMEFRRARWDEPVDPGLGERHRREIYPLLHRRWQFAEAAGFLLYDFESDGGGVDDDVYAYSNMVDGHGSLVLFNNKYKDTAGRISVSSPFVDKAGGSAATTRTLGDGLGLEGGEHDFLTMREVVSGRWHVLPSRAIVDGGFHMHLGAFEHRVFIDLHEVTDHTGAHALVADRFAEQGVPDLDEALLEVRTGPMHAALAAFADAVRPVGDGEVDAPAALVALDGFAAEADALGMDIAPSSKAVIAQALGRLADAEGDI
ncbi:alpha-amylase, partial [bacterium]|nr:alpha-amylase [bacterium]